MKLGTKPEAFQRDGHTWYGLFSFLVKKLLIMCGFTYFCRLPPLTLMSEDTRAILVTTINVFWYNLSTCTVYAVKKKCNAWSLIRNVIETTNVHAV